MASRCAEHMYFSYRAEPLLITGLSTQFWRYRKFIISISINLRIHVSVTVQAYVRRKKISLAETCLYRALHTHGILPRDAMHKRGLCRCG